MKKKLLVMLIMCALCAALFAGCSNVVTREKLEKQYGDRITVKFEMGEGCTISSQDNMSVFYYYQKDSSGAAQIIQPGTGKLSDTRPGKAGHFLEGWYTSGDFAEKWDFSRKTDKDLTLYAKWLPNFKYVFYYVDANNEEQRISSVDVGQGGTLSASAKVSRDGHTLLGLYSDRECENKWDHSTKHIGTVENGESVNTEVKVYTDWLEGEYTLVSKPSDFLSVTAGGNFYLLNSIDFTNSDTEWNGGTVDFDGIIEGNGHTIKGVTAEFPVFGVRTAEWGIFKTLKMGAKLKNVKFENVTVTIEDTMTQPRSVGLLAGIVEEGVTLENVELSGKIVLKTVARPGNYTMGLIAGELNSSVAGVVRRIDIDNRLSGYGWHLDETDPNFNAIVFTEL